MGEGLQVGIITAASTQDVHKNVQGQVRHDTLHDTHERAVADAAQARQGNCCRHAERAAYQYYSLATLLCLHTPVCRHDNGKHGFNQNAGRWLWQHAPAITAEKDVFDDFHTKNLLPMKVFMGSRSTKSVQKRNTNAAVGCSR